MIIATSYQFTLDFCAISTTQGSSLLMTAFNPLIQKLALISTPVKSAS